MEYTLNPDEKKVNQVLNALKYTNGHCPCKTLRTEENICPCKDMRENSTCICGLYIK